MSRTYASTSYKYELCDYDNFICKINDVILVSKTGFAQYKGKESEIHACN